MYVGGRPNMGKVSSHHSRVFMKSLAWPWLALPCLAYQTSRVVRKEGQDSFGVVWRFALSVSLSTSVEAGRPCKAGWGPKASKFWPPLSKGLRLRLRFD